METLRLIRDWLLAILGRTVLVEPGKQKPYWRSSRMKLKRGTWSPNCKWQHSEGTISHKSVTSESSADQIIQRGKERRNYGLDTVDTLGELCTLCKRIILAMVKNNYNKNKNNYLLISWLSDSCCLWESASHNALLISQAWKQQSYLGSLFCGILYKLRSLAT